MKTYVELIYDLENGSSKKIRVNDLRQDIDDASITALANLFLTKNSQSKGSNFSKLKSCTKYSLEETKII